jgi:hypothetical protein
MMQLKAVMENLKSKSALSRYIFSGQGPDAIDKNSIDFDEIPSV